MLKLNVPEKFKYFKNRGSVTFGHVHYCSLLSAGFVSSEYNQAAYKFCITRNPYKRAVSLYYYRKNNEKYSGEFVQFLSDVRLKRPPVGLYNAMGLSLANPQVDWILGKDGEFVVDELFSLAKLNEVEAVMKDRFGVNDDSNIGRKNVSKKETGYEELLQQSSETVPLIKDIYARDFEVLGYSYDDLE